MLPKEIEQLIYYYLGRFTIASNRPSLSSVRRLVRKSNRDIAERYIGEVYPDFPLTTSLFFTQDININLVAIFRNPQSIMCFYTAILESTQDCFATGGLRWLYVNSDLVGIPEYKRVFVGSYYIRVTNP